MKEKKGICTANAKVGNMVDIAVLPVLSAKLTGGKAGRVISGEKERMRRIDNHSNHRIIRGKNGARARGIGRRERRYRGRRQ